jgi:hypothetical protein
MPLLLCLSQSLYFLQHLATIDNLLFFSWTKHGWSPRTNFCYFLSDVIMQSGNWDIPNFLAVLFTDILEPSISFSAVSSSLLHHLGILLWFAVVRFRILLLAREYVLMTSQKFDAIFVPFDHGQQWLDIWRRSLIWLLLTFLWIKYKYWQLFMSVTRETAENGYS